MNNSNFVRVSGWAFVIGGFLFYMSSVYTLFPFYYPNLSVLYYLNSLGVNTTGLVVGWFFMYILMFYGSPIVLAIGMFGLRARYGEQVGSFGKIILLLCPLGILISYYGLTQAGIDKQDGFVSTAGLIVLLTCLTMFGVLTLTTKPLPRWNGLPIIAGIGFPAFFFSRIVSETNRMQSISQFGLLVLVVTVQSVALVMLGYMLKSDVLEETRSYQQEQTA